jgi:hypothetical protein
MLLFQFQFGLFTLSFSVKCQNYTAVFRLHIKLLSSGGKVVSARGAPLLAYSVLNITLAHDVTPCVLALWYNNILSRFIFTVKTLQITYLQMKVRHSCSNYGGLDPPSTDLGFMRLETVWTGNDIGFNVTVMNKSLSTKHVISWTYLKNNSVPCASLNASVQQHHFILCSQTF